MENKNFITVEEYEKEKQVVQEALNRRNTLLGRQTVSEKNFYTKLRNSGVVLIPQKIIFKDGLLITSTGSYYIVDFYSPNSHLVIEIDGGYHKEYFQQVRDRKREKTILEMGFNLMRFDNEQIDTLDYNKLKKFIRELANERHAYNIGGIKFHL